jgi:hypothetical protein
MEMAMFMETGRFRLSEIKMRPQLLVEVWMSHRLSTNQPRSQIERGGNTYVDIPSSSLISGQVDHEGYKSLWFCALLSSFARDWSIS